MIKAPFTKDQITALNRYQQAGFMHPFTCPGERNCNNRNLIARRTGWVCACGAFTQDWAHEFMIKD